MSDTIRIGPKGRVVIPAEARRRLGVEEGDELCIVVREDSIELMPRAAVLRRLRSMTAEGDASMVDALIEGRRAEARADASS